MSAEAPGQGGPGNASHSRLFPPRVKVRRTLNLSINAGRDRIREVTPAPPRNLLARFAPRAASFRLDADLLDQAGPFHQLGLHIRVEFLRAAEKDLDPRIEETLLQVGTREHL